jgi:hypothetical protein
MSEDSVAVTGWNWQIAFPPICPKCGQAASTQLKVEKVFEDADDSSKSPHVESFRVPFCAKCAREHYAEMSAVPTSAYWKRFFTALPFLLPGGIAFVLGLNFSRGGLRDFLQGDFIGLILLGGVGLFCLGMSAWFLFTAWSNTRHLTARPPTSITEAVDFTENRASLFDPVWREFTFFYPTYASRFAEVNAQRLWSPDHPRARLGSTLRWIVIIAVGLFLLALALVGVADKYLPAGMDWLQGFFSRLLNR